MRNCTKILLLMAAVAAGPRPLRAAWTPAQECLITDKVLVASSFYRSDSPADLTLERAGQALLTDPAGGAHSLLQMPGCTLKAIEVPRDPEYGFPSLLMTRGGLGVYDSGKEWRIVGPGEPSRILRVPRHYADWDEGWRPAPMPDPDGKALAWLEPEPGSKGRFIDGKGELFPVRATIQSLKTGEESAVRLPPYALSRKDGSLCPTLLALDMGAKELTLHVDDDPLGRTPRFFSVRFDGSIGWGPLRPEGVTPGAYSFRRVGRGWVAWDTGGISWSLPAGTGVHKVSRLRGVEYVAVDPLGEYIVVGAGINPKIGRLQLPVGAVYVLRVKDGERVFKISTGDAQGEVVSFVGPRFFAYSEYGWNSGHHQTRVLRIPGR